MIIDAHHLLGVDHWLRQNLPSLAHKHNGKDVVTSLDSVTDKWIAYVSPFPSCQDKDYIHENEYVLDACAQDSRLRAIVAVNPLVPSSCTALERFLSAGADIHGIMIWPILCRIDLEMLAKNCWFSDITRQWSLPVTVHVPAGNEQRIGRVERMERYLPQHAISLAAALPDVRFNLSHVLRLSSSALQAASTLPNVWMDTSGLTSLGMLVEQGEFVFPADDAGLAARLPPHEVLRMLVDELMLGNRLMYATSTPFNTWWGCDAALDFQLLERAGLSASQLRALTFENAFQFFKKS